MLPCPFVAVMINVVCGNAEVGVPVIAQVVGFRVNPSGKAGLIVQDVMLPVKLGVMLSGEPTVKVVELEPEVVVKVKLEGAEFAGLGVVLLGC